jgi:hypothetical protein
VGEKYDGFCVGDPFFFLPSSLSFSVPELTLAYFPNIPLIFFLSDLIFILFITIFQILDYLWN